MPRVNVIGAMWSFGSVLWVSWNLFLAVIPVALASAVVRLHEARWPRVIRWPAVGIALLAWLVFLPNTCYLLTEWRHFLVDLDSSNLYLRARADSQAALLMMLWVVFYFCYSAFGMLAFTLAIRPIARLARQHGLPIPMLAVLLFGLLSLGVYLGLVLRFNSWDLVTRPTSVFASVAALRSRPLLTAFLVTFGVFLWLAYGALDIWVEGFKARRKSGRVPA